MKSVAIIGLGLMGGSLGMAIRTRGLAREVRGFARREETRRRAIECGAVDRVFATPEAAVEGAEAAVFCTPVLSIAPLVRQCKARFSRGCMITDVGSTKAALTAELEPLFADGQGYFVGSHPIAGSEQTGIESARADLYENAAVIVAPSGKTSKAAVAAVSRFWEALGARVSVVSPEEHDRMIARSSHLPHLVAATLVATAAREGGAPASFWGPGFRDTTRVAEGSPEMWHDILRTNRGPVLTELKALQSVLARLAEDLESGDFGAVRRFLDKARRARAALLNRVK